MKQKRMSVSVAAAAAIAILLLLIFWSRPSSRTDLVRDPGTENSDMVDTTADDLTAESAHLTESTIVHRFGPSDEWYAAGAKGETYAGALIGDGFRMDATTEVFLGQSPPDGPYLPDYRIGRAYLSWDTSELPDDAKVLSATLVLDLPASGGREEAFDIVVYRGDWKPSISLEDWQSPGSQAVGRWHLSVSRIEERDTVHTDQGITLYAPEPAHPVRVSLNPAVIEMEGVTRLELRHAGEGASPITAEGLSVGRSQITLEVKYRP
jgi:hypothetical protein